MKSELFIKWDMYARQDDITFRKYWIKYNPYGHDVFQEAVIYLKKQDGNAVSKDDLIYIVQEATLFPEDKVAECITALIENEMLKEENGKYYSARVRQDIEEADNFSKKQTERIRARWDKAKNTSGNTDSNTSENIGNTSGNTSDDTIKKEKEKEIEKDKTREKQEKEKKEISVKEKFTPPTLEEVQAYCSERGKGVDAQRFIDYYSAGNWHDSHGDPIKNWKQKMIANWEGKTWWQKAPTLSTGITLGQSGHYKPEDYEGIQEKIDRGEDVF